MRYDIRTLQNGSEIIGIASEGVQGEDINLTQNNAGAIGTAFLVWLASKIDKPIFTLKICVGQDPRISSDELKAGIMMGVQMTGSKSYDAGIATSDAMYMSQVMDFYEFDGAVMITGGHQPYNMNGFKFFTKEGILAEEDVQWIISKAYKYAFIGEWYECEPVNLMDMYAAHLRWLISGELGTGKCLEGMHIVVDASNGSGGFFATSVLEKLGADISGSANLEPDGMFPGHEPDPGNNEVISGMCKAVEANKADLGIIFDADLSRCTVVSAEAKPCTYDGNGADYAIQAIVAAAKLKKDIK